MDEMSLPAASCIHKISWCVKIDSAIFDVGKYSTHLFSITTQLLDADGYDVFQSVSISKGLTMIRKCCQEARALKNVLRETTGRSYTYSHTEDCFRYITRKFHQNNGLRMVAQDAVSRNGAKKYNFYGNSLLLWGDEKILENVRAPYRIIQS